MSSYFIRIFSITPRSNLLDLQNAVWQSGLTVEPVGTNQLLITDGRNDPLTIELTDMNSAITQTDIVELTEMVQKSRTSSAEARIFVLNNLVRTVALMAINVPETMDSAMVEWVVEQLLGAEDLLHIEGEGFYLDGELIVPLR